MQNNLSIYIHWPFCLSKCPYCDFNSHILSTVDHDLWLESYISELNHFEELIKNKNIKSIFFGGGTPSLMEPFVVEGIINKIAFLGIVDNKTEITLEANPTSFETEKFKAFNRAGVNRVSIGVQSLNNDDLKFLGRKHDADEAIKAIEAAKSILPRISFDLIYARTNQTLHNWQKELTKAMDLASGHISLYQLTIEKGTKFFKLFQEGELTIPNQDMAADMYNWTNSYLESKNYCRYEISNYAKLQNESIHNLTYWNYNNYLGIGPGAHSRITEYLGDKAFTKSIMMWHRPDKWLQSISELGHAIQTKHTLSLQETIEEFFMMGLRLKHGIDFSNLKRFGNLKLFDMIDQKVADDYVRLQLLDYSDDNIRLTEKGLMLHNYLVPRLIRVK